jgi:hypothetical protein
MKKTKLSFSEQLIVELLAKLNSIDPNLALDYKDEVSEEVWELATKEQ